MKAIPKGIASQANRFVIFITIGVLLDRVELGGGFESLSELLAGSSQHDGPTGVMLIASLVGGFGIEAAAAAHLRRHSPPERRGCTSVLGFSPPAGFPAPRSRSRFADNFLDMVFRLPFE